MAVGKGSLQRLSNAAKNGPKQQETAEKAASTAEAASAAKAANAGEAVSTAKAANAGEAVSAEKAANAGEAAGTAKAVNAANAQEEASIAEVRRPEPKKRGRKKKTETSASDAAKQPAGERDAITGRQTGGQQAVRSKIVCVLPDYLL